MDEQEQASESSEDIGIENLFSNLGISNANTPEVQSSDCSSGSNSCSTPTQNDESNNDGGICLKGGEQLPTTSSADLQPLGTDEDKIMLKITSKNEFGTHAKLAPADEGERMFQEETATESERHNAEDIGGTTEERSGRNTSRSSGSNSPQEEDEDFHAARSPADNASENSTSSQESRFARFMDDDIAFISSIEQANTDILCDLLNKPKPAYTWNTTYELMRRENGLSSDGRRFLRSSSASGFHKRFHSSRLVVERMKVSECLIKHDGSVTSLGFDRSGKLLCSGSDDTRIIVWNWAQRKPIIVFDSVHTENILQTKFIHSSGHLDIVSASRDGQVRRSIISSDGAEPETTLLYRHNGPVHKIVTSQCDPNNIFSAGGDGHIRCKDIRCNDPAVSICKVKNQISKRRVRLYSIAHHPSSPQICASGSDNIVRVFDKRNMKERVHEMCPSPLVDTSFTQVTSAVYNITGTEILASYSNDHIYLFNNNEYKTGDYLHRYVGRCNHATMQGVNFFGPHSEFVVSGSECGNIFFWDKNTEAVVNFLPGDTTETDVVNCLEPHPVIPLIASAGLYRNIKVWTPCSPIYPPDLSKLETVVKQNFQSHTLQKIWDLHERRNATFWRQYFGVSLSNSNSSSNSSGEDDLSQIGGI